MKYPTAAVATVIATATQLVSAVRASTRALAAIRPTETGTSPRLQNDTPARVLELLPDAACKKSEQATRPAHRGGGGERARDPGDVIADQRDDDDVRPRRDLGDGKQVGELTVGHPAGHLDGLAVHLGHHRIGAADREQREQRKMRRKREQRAAVRLHRQPDFVGWAKAP